MRYKYSLPNHLKTYVEGQLTYYHENKKQLEAYKRDLIPSATPSYSLTGGTGGGDSEHRPNEDIILKMVNDQYIRQTEITVTTIEKVLNHLPPEDLKIIDYHYWKGMYTIEGAAIALNMSRSTAYRKVNNILCAIAMELGLIMRIEK